MTEQLTVKLPRYSAGRIRIRLLLLMIMIMIMMMMTMKFNNNEDFDTVARADPGIFKGGVQILK
jgi:hypothetical protein